MDVALLSFGVILFLLGLIGKVEAEKIKAGDLEFAQFSDRNSFIGKYTRNTESNKIRLWKGTKSN